jgi:phosphopantetheinyl transferase
MPLLKKIEVENGVLGIWGLKESVETLISGFHFTENEQTEFEKFKFEKRQTEYLATRLLLQNLLGEKAEIIYQDSGRPLIKNSTKNISISHSSDLVVVFISNKLTGVDAENANRNIDKVVKRFLHPKEIEWIEKSNNPQLLKILFWCAKEAIYKCACKTGIQFDTQVYISPFEYSKTNLFQGKIIFQNQEKNYKMCFINCENNIIVYCVEVENESI